MAASIAISMPYYRLLPLLFAIVPTCFALPSPAPSFVYSGDPAYGVETSKLADILTCPYGIPESNPVLLVPGTGSTGEESFGEGYVPALKANGFTPCYLTPPGRLMGDMQVTSAYIAYNMHYLSYLSKSPIAVLGHSQANPDILWSLRFFSSTRSVVSQYVGLSPDFLGIGVDGIQSVCEVDDTTGKPECAASIWQQLAGSHYHAAQRDPKGAGFQEYVPTTLIWSLTDEIVIPSGPNAHLPKAVNIPVQELCPGRVTDHFLMLIDAAGFALALDALTHGGVGSVTRVRDSRTGRQSCLEETAPHMNVSVAVTASALYEDVVSGILLGPHKVSAEPPVKAYALPKNQ